jgi:hypothetical protein
MTKETPLDDLRQKTGFALANWQAPGKAILRKSSVPALRSPIRTNGRKPTRIKREHVMGLASYEIVGSAGEWWVSHDGKAENVYQTKESAFEAALASASLALRQGHEVRILAPVHGTATGAANPG